MSTTILRIVKRSSALSLLVSLLVGLALSHAGATTLSQNRSMAITRGGTFYCSPEGFARDNRYLRRFRFSDYGISTAFDVSRVDIGVDEASTGEGVSVLLFSIGTSLPLLAANLTWIGGVDLSVPAGSGFLLPVSVTAAVAHPASQDLVVEVFVPGRDFLIGSNSAGETQPSYILAPDCDLLEPTSFQSLGFQGIDIVLTVSGTARTTSVTNGDMKPALALESVRPNPSRGRHLAVTFSLAGDEPAKLELIDVCGRRVASDDLGNLGRGQHVIDLELDRGLAPGLYLVRLAQGARTQWMRATVLN